MSATRNKMTVVSRVSGSDRFVRVEKRAFGGQSNCQRQCSTGEHEFDTETRKFVFVKKEDRRPHQTKESMDMPLVTVRERA